MAEDEVRETIDEAHDENEERAQDPGATTGQAQEDPAVGHVEPEAGSGDAPESEIPKGVDALTDEQIAQAEEAGPVGGGDDDDGALDVSALMDDGGGDDAAADNEGGADADDATPDDDTSGETASS
jgi:hypothetical protein